MRYRKIGKMNYCNDSSRTLLESILIDPVLAAMRTLINNNDMEDVVLIGGLAVSYYSRPYISYDIDILVRNKRKFKYFSNSQYRNGVKLDIYDLADFGLTNKQFDDIKSSCEISDGCKIMNASHLMSLFFRNHMSYLRCIGFLFENCYIDNKIMQKYSTVEEYKKYEFFLIYSKKNYRMNYIKPYNQIVKFKIFEGVSLFAQLNTAFRDWVLGNEKSKQVLIGGMAVFNYIQERTTSDVDFVFLSEDDIPSNVNSFKRVRPHCFRHISTHVDIEVLTPDFLSINPELIKIVFDTAFDKGDFRIASPSSIVALKLTRINEMDISDIKALVDNYQVDITPFIPYLSDVALKNLELLKQNFNIEI